MTNGIIGVPGPRKNSKQTIYTHAQGKQVDRSKKKKKQTKKQLMTEHYLGCETTF